MNARDTHAALAHCCQLRAIEMDCGRLKGWRHEVLAGRRYWQRVGPAVEAEIQAQAERFQQRRILVAFGCI